MQDTCEKDYCDIDFSDDIDYNEVAKTKLNRWLRELDPIDYDAPGTTTREHGV